MCKFNSRHDQNQKYNIMCINESFCLRSHAALPSLRQTNSSSSRRRLRSWPRKLNPCCTATSCGAWTTCSLSSSIWCSGQGAFMMVCVCFKHRVMEKRCRLVNRLCFCYSALQDQEPWSWGQYDWRFNGSQRSAWRAGADVHNTEGVLSNILYFYTWQMSHTLSPF